MQHSGSKLVIALTSLAFMLGITSWWYRYEAAHRASKFWGPEASRLIAQSERFEVIRLDSSSDQNLTTLGTELSGEPTDLSRARGQAHLRHVLMSDRNFIWSNQLDAAATAWRWRLRFYEGDREAVVLLSEDLAAVGKLGPVGRLAVLSCAPMSDSLIKYFEALGLVAKPQAAASMGVE